MTILVITTGGTIGAMPYSDFDHTAEPEFVAIMPPDKKDLVREALAGFSDIEARCISLEPTDSKFMDELYRYDILKIIESAPENRILVTHGTDALLLTADFFYQQFAINPVLKNKTILLTGAMVPLTNGLDSDGYMNLKYSLEKLSIVNSELLGVYIVLCDYQDVEAKTGWQPRLYRFEPGRYEKFFDPEDGRRSRIRQIEK